jgi:hypothetical protein
LRSNYFKKYGTSYAFRISPSLTLTSFRIYHFIFIEVFHISLNTLNLNCFRSEKLLIPDTTGEVSRFSHSTVLTSIIMKSHSFRRWTVDFIDTDILCISFIADTRVIDFVTIIIPLQYPTTAVAQLGDNYIRRHCCFRVREEIESSKLSRFLR